MKKFRYFLLLFTSLWLWIDFITCASQLLQGIQPLIFVTPKDIRLANSTKNSPKPKVQVLVKNLTDGIALDFNYAAKKLCWTDHGLEMIQCVTYDGTNVGNKVEVVSSGLLSPDGLACDWYTNKLYWTDGETNRIEVATMNGEYRKVLFWSDIDQPRAIVLAPMRGLMFWTDWGETPKIERAGMNGDPSTRQIIVSEDIFWPNGLTVDYENELIYWLDGKLKFIAVMNYEGGKRRKIVTKGLVYPFAITQYRGRFYFTDWQTCCVYSYDNATNMVQPREIIHSEYCPMDIHVWEEKRQPPPEKGKNYCAQPENGGCSHLCLLSPNPPYYTCECPIGIKLIDDKNCAPGPQKLLIIALRTEICIVYLDSLDYTHRSLPLKDVRYSIAVDYDPNDGFVYWTDDETKSIRRAKLDGSQQENVIYDDITHPDGLAIDWVARNLYWADTGTDRIEVSRLDGTHRRVLLYEGLYEPRAIALAPHHGWIFWSDWNEKQPKIERAALDGTERRVIVSGSLGWPNGVTLDLERDRLYWCDAKFDKIETSNMDGTERIVLTADRVPHTFGLSLMGDWLYWTDWQRRSIDRVHKLTGVRRETITDQMPNVMGLKAVELNQNITNTSNNKTNPCAFPLNGGCAHLCFNRPKDYICACQTGYELTPDKKSCVLPSAFLLSISSNSTIGRISIENGNNEQNDITIPISLSGSTPSLKSSNALDFDLIDGSMYWIDSKQQAIYRSFVNGSNAYRLVEVGLRALGGIAVDWIAKNLYWTDSLTSRIEVCRLDGTSRRALIWQGLQDPRSIILEPSYGLMYWTEWGGNHFDRINFASLDGQNVQELISKLEQPRSLTIDEPNRQLYWIEGNSEPEIQRCNLPNCYERTILVRNLIDPMGIAAFKGLLYFSERKGDIFSFSNGVRKVLQSYNPRLLGSTALRVLHSERKLQNSQCSIKNGGCSHLCFSLPNNGSELTNSYSCACPTHFTLHGNHSCVPPKSFMIYSQRNSVVRFVTETKDCPEAVLPIHNLKTIKSVAFDPVSRYLYWIEGKSHTIKRAPDDGSQPATVIVSSGSGSRGSGALINPYDLALDPIGRLLFWTCTIQEAINVTRIENGSTIGIVMQREGEKPRLLTLHPIRRVIFWTDIGNEPQILRARLDGSHRISIKRTVHNVTAISLDLENDMVVWAEGNQVFMCNIDGENQYEVLSEGKGYVGQLTVHQGSLFWLERSYQQQQLRKFDLNSARHDSVKLIHASGGITDLISINEVSSSHPCSNNRCQQICIGRNNETGPICACAQGLALSEDGYSCVAVPECGGEFFTCSTTLGHGLGPGGSSNDCIPIGWRCDGQSDCQDGSDEMNCPACRSDQFRCRIGGQCIEKNWVCDGDVQCPDGSDESRCCTPETEFRCPETDVCIPILEVCDGYENCANGTDESDLVCKNIAKRGFSLNPNQKPSTTKGGVYIIVILIAITGAIILPLIMYYGYKKWGLKSNLDQGNPQTFTEPHNNRNKPTQPHPDLINMQMLGGYDRCHITGASSSTNGSSSATGGICYPRETLNPPPSPATTGISRDSTSTRHRPYHRYRSINQPPPPTPCSTDICDESDCNYGGNLSIGVRYAPFPPPPTPCRSNCPDSCPPSPSSRSSTYFSPLPPPPSPVPPPPESTAPLLDNYDDSLP